MLGLKSGLKADANGIAMVHAARVLDVPEKALYRYFWGIKDKKNGPPITASQVKNFEATIPLLVLKFKNYREGTSMAKATSGPCEARDSSHIYLIRTADRGVTIVDQLGDKTAFKKAKHHPDTWILTPKRHKAGQPTLGRVHLFPGFRARHVFTRGKLEGRCFEMHVVADNEAIGPAGLSYAYLPKFVIRQLIKNDDGFAVATSMRGQGMTPNAAWSELYAKFGLPPNKNAYSVFGFNDPGLQDMLDPSVNGDVAVYGQRKGLADMTARWVRSLISAANNELVAAMKKVCPSNPIGAFQLLRNSSAFQAEFWPDRDSEELLGMPFLSGMAKSHQAAPTCEAKLGILSLVAPFFKSAVVQRLFGCTQRDVTAARLHAADDIAGVAPPHIKQERMRLSPRTFAFLHQWCNSSFAVSASDASSSKLKRHQIRERLYPLYKSMAETELNTKAVSRAKFFSWMDEGFVDDTAETCCCAGCVDGWLAMDMLQDMVMDVKYKFPARNNLVKRIDQVRDFMKGDFRWKHLKESSNEVMHCMGHALGCECQQLCQPCNHEHQNTCLECNQWGGLIEECKAISSLTLP